MRRALWLAAAGLLALCSAPAALALQDPSKELAAIAEEQQLLRRQLQRLRQTMEVLVPRLEAEGRTQALKLLQEGLTFLGDRHDAAGSLTLEELMDDAREDVAGGQLVSSLEKQQSIADALERLLAILMDRENLEGLEQALLDLRTLRAELGLLSEREGQLQRETAELGERAKSDAQRALEQKIAALTAAQRELLAQNEAGARSSGGLALEELERALEELARRQQVDEAVLSAWEPAAEEPLAAASAALESARSLGASSERARQAAAELESAARAARSEASPEALAAAQRALDAAAQTAERHARASADATAQAAAKALREGATALQGAGANPDELERAAQGLEARAAELAAEAAREEAAAAAARAEAAAALAPAEDAAGAAGEAADAARSALDEAQGAAERGAEDAARAATESAARALREGLEAERALGPVLAGSQARQAEDAQRLQRGVEGISEQQSQGAPKEANEALGEAAAALEQAGQAMEQASRAARGERAGEASAEAAAASAALEAARAALARARTESAARGAEGQGSAAAELAAEQARLADEADQAAAEAPAAAREQGGSLDDGAARAAAEALERAGAAMQRAAGELAQGRSGAAAEAQREALEALAEAGRESAEGTRAASPEDRERAAELAAEQEAIRSELLELARRNEERSASQPLPSLDNAGQKAAQASGSLSAGELPEAEQAEEEVQRELQQAESALAEEEEQYERLRQEELLFRIGEEVDALRASHAEAMGTTREIDAERGAAEKPTRAQRLRLRRVAQSEAALAARVAELAEAIRAEDTLVFAELLSDVQADLERVAERLDEAGDYDSGERVQGLQEDVAESLAWLSEALEAERLRRSQQEAGNQQQQQQDPGENRLVPDVAELKLLRRMELESLDRLRRLLVLYPDLAELPSDDPLIQQDILRLAERHERTSELFRQFRTRLGVPDPEPPTED